MGARLGRYLVLKHLASGGMADVLLGRSEGIEGFQRHVVLKRIRPEHARDQRFIRMFVDEARVAANLHHQHIVQVHDVGAAAGEYFIAMEYIHGEDVRTILSTASRVHAHVPLGYAIAIVAAAAAGLHYAHERRGADKRTLGIVHRDVSPSNILVGYDGSIKIVDFGIAKAAMRQETRSGALKGKVSYMSPEQCKGEPVDRRSDVYSLGVVLYELATTTRLFKGDNDYLVMDQIVNGRVPVPRVRRPDLPAELSAIIMRAIAPDPERRYFTADELYVALEQFATKTGLMASTSAVAAYMRKQFGDRPEPWLELDDKDEFSFDDGLASGTPGSNAWIEVPLGDSARRRGVAPPRPAGSQVMARRADPPVASAIDSAIDSAINSEIDSAIDSAISGVGSGPADATSVDGAGAFRGDPGGFAGERGSGSGSHDRVQRVPVVRLPSTPSPTDAKMGWESHHPRRAPRGFSLARLAMVSVPLIALLGIAIWQLSGSPTTVAPNLTIASQPPPTAPPTAAPVPASPAHEDTAVAPSVKPIEPPEIEMTETASPAHAKRRRSSAKNADATSAITAPGAAPGAGPTPSPTVGAPPTTSSPVPSSAAAPPSSVSPALGPSGATGAAQQATVPVAPAPPAVAAPVPPAADQVVPQLSHAAIDRVAAEHQRDLSRCDGGEELHGEVTVKFAIDAAGKVTQAQVATTIKKPQVATCILRLLQKWQFPRQGSAGAQGTYTLLFQ
ncbi:MAG TPA: protein kinase [Kofleriaceae bacterium]|nr:protein kinase [Kofleriaceae bacterium]